MHMESAGYGAYSDWEVSDCIFEWGGRPDVTDDAHNAPCIGLGLSPIERGAIRRCCITNTESQFGLQTHDNVGYITRNGQRAVNSGCHLVIEDCAFNDCSAMLRTTLDTGRIAVTPYIAFMTGNIGISKLFKNYSPTVPFNWRVDLKANEITINELEDYVV